MPATAHFASLRLKPGDDLLTELDGYVARNSVRAGWIAGVVGSLSQATLRFASRAEATVLINAFEITALSGTLCPDGPHLHMSIADTEGQMLGGHVMFGCIIRTTCELVIAELDDTSYSRQPCPLSGYDELVVSHFTQNKENTR